jgi:sigma-B regulation protein RsbU (phosphoserine phosphatase)
MRSGRVLLVEDEAGCMGAVGAVLSRAHEVRVVQFDAGAERVVEELLPQVVVCPLSAAGLEWMDEVRERLGEVDFVCAYRGGQDTEVGTALRAGVSHCLARPIDPQVVWVLVMRCLEAQAEREAARQSRERLERELADARQLQSGMLPAADARLGRAGISVSVRCRACAEVAGDLADYAEIGSGRAAILIADVVGHGVGAAMLTTVVKTAFVSASAWEYDPARVVSAVAQGLRPFGAGRFVTLIAARLDRTVGRVEYVNAGHPAGWVIRKGKVVAELAPTGPLVCPAIDGAWEVRTAALPEHGGVLLYTDGVVDAAGERGRFGVERLADEVARSAALGGGLLDRVMGAVEALRGRGAAGDDLTMLVASVGVPGLG